MRWLPGLIFILILNACSTKSGLQADITPAEPLSIAVNQELNDGEHLRIAASVTARVEWPVDDAEVNLITMHGDQVVEQRKMRLGMLLSKQVRMLAAEQSYPILLDVPARGADNYQLSLFWGSEAQSSSSASFNLSKVEHIRQECSSNCKEKLNVIGSLVNDGSKTISSAELQIEVYQIKEGGQPLDLQGRTPDNVQSLVLDSLVLAPGKERKLKLVLDTPVSMAANGSENTAVVRVVKVND